MKFNQTLTFFEVRRYLALLIELYEREKDFNLPLHSNLKKSGKSRR
jgi:hypothetical protein